MGKDGSRAYYDARNKQGDENSFMVEAPAFLQEHTIETTGAGDTFGGCPGRRRYSRCWSMPGRSDLESDINQGSFTKK